MLSKALTTAAAGSAGGDYQISRSLRFNSADSAYLSRTPASAGDREAWTWSGWVKRSGLSVADRQTLFGGYGASNDTDWLEFGFNITTDALYWTTQNQTASSTAVFRDVSAWYHVVVNYDSTYITFYVNNQQVLQSARGSFGLAASLGINGAWLHTIGKSPKTGVNRYFNGYLADINFIDGQALTPSSFGETDATTGVWKPIRYAGSYGTNGFHLDFSDNSSTTALGYDAAGSNDWTPNNFSVTAGAGNDSLVDSPTQYGTDTGAGGEVRGNYCTANPLDSGGVTCSNGNLKIAFPTDGLYNSIRSTMGMSTGKWYWEVVSSDIATLNPRGFAGIADAAMALTNMFVGNSSGSWGYYNSGAEIYNNGSGTSYGSQWLANDIIGVAFDADNGKLWFSINGTYPNSGDPAAGTNAGASSIPSSVYFPAFSMVGSNQGTFDLNFGQRPFAYTAPSGFKALCTTNLPEPTILKGNQHFNTAPYEGTSSSGNAITVGFQPDLVWIKRREVGGYPHLLMDAVRGFSGTDARVLQANDTAAEVLNGAFESFDSNGFTVGGTNPTSGAFNSGPNNFFVSWNWKANGAGSLNEVGSIPSTVSANTTAGISIVTYTGTGANATVGHGLGVAPRMLIIKRRDTTGTWRVGHSSLTSWAYRLNLNETAEEAINTGAFNSTAPTSTVFSVGTDTSTNASAGTYVAYCFAEVESFSKFGSYTGNGSADGPFIFTGFRPAWVMFKTTSSLGGIQNYASWLVQDSIRNPANPVSYTTTLWANKTYEEGLRGEGSTAGTYLNIDFLSNGFKLLGNSAEINASGATVIYAAFAENPFKNALAR